MRTVEIYDTTLRDGAQAEDVALSVEDKLRITEKLDELGVSYIEGGWPGANPKDTGYFQEVKKIALKLIALVFKLLQGIQDLTQLRRILGNLNPILCRLL